MKKGVFSGFPNPRVGSSTELKKNDITIEDVDVINNKYKELAQEYMKALPLEAQGLVMTKETKKLKLINDSIKYANKLNEIRALSKDRTCLSKFWCKYIFYRYGST
ncbi:hypothetical protein ACTFQF_17565 [Aliivibrio fischeri]|uniref:hypothetical protein n=1 Tax=Aliivibrio fischeri TaxID=668 RepID=UPI003F7761D5